MFREVREYTLDEPGADIPSIGTDMPLEAAQTGAQVVSGGEMGRFREISDFSEADLDPIPEPPKESTAKRLGRTMKEFGRSTLGKAEAGAEFGGGMVSFMNPIPGFAALGLAKEKFKEGEFETIMAGSPYGAAFEVLDTDTTRMWEDTTANIQKAQAVMEPYLVYSPKTPEGKAASETVHSFLNWLITNPSETAGDLSLEVLAPVIGAQKAAIVATGIKSGLELAGYVALFGMGRGRGKGRAIEKPKITEKGIREFEEFRATEQGISDIARNIEQKALPRGPIVAPGKAEVAPPIDQPGIIRRYQEAEGIDTPYKRLPEAPEAKKALERGPIVAPEGKRAPVDPTVARYREVALEDIKLDKEPKALERGALEMPEGADVPRGTPEAIAKSLDIKYNGIQEGAGKIPDTYLFTDTLKGRETTFAVEKLEDVGKRLEEKRAEFKMVPKIKRLISEEAYKKAQASIKEKTTTTLRAGIDPTLLKDMAVVAAYHIETGARGFVKFSEDMVKEYGEKIKPYLAPAWREAKRQTKKLKPTEDIVEKVVPTRDKFARSVNLDRLNIPEAQKDLLREAGGKREKKKQTWDQTGELSEQILGDYKKTSKVLQKAKKGEALTAVELDTVRQIEVNAIDRLAEISKTKTREEFNKDFTRFESDIFTAVSSASSESGRALNVLRKEVSMRRIGKAFTELERQLNPREFKEFKELDFDNPLAVQRFVERLGDPKLMDYVYEYWYNSILSGIPTHAVNVISNTAWGLFQVPHRGLVGALDIPISKLTGRPREVYVQEVVPYFAGFLKGFKRGTGRAMEVVKTGREPLDLGTKWDRDIGSSTLSAFERSPNKALRAAAPVLTAPTRALRAMDVWFNTAAMDGELAALARRESLKTGKKGEALKAHERKLLEAPTEQMLKDAAIQAKYSTFMDEPGKFTSWILKGREAIPGSRFVVPFVNTISNLMKRGLEMTPGVGLAMAKGKKPAEVLAKQVEGAILSLYILHKVDKGEITGAVPKNKAEREAFYRAGKKPWAIKSGDTWIQYRRIEPFNTVIASVAIAHDAIKNADNEDTATGIFLDTAAGVTENLLDSSYLQGLTNLLDKYGTRRRGMAQRLAASFVPFSSFWRSINRSYEVATEGSTKVRDTKSLTGAFSQVIPGLSKLAAPRLNVWGEEIEMQGGVFRQWLPYKWSTETADPVEKELERLEIYPGLPGRMVTIRGEREELSDKVYRDYALSYGAEAYKEMQTQISRSNFKTMSDEHKIKFLDGRLKNIKARYLKRAKREHTKRSK